MTTTFASWNSPPPDNTPGDWPDAYVAGLRDGERAGRVAMVLPYDESSGLIAELVGHLAYC